MWHLERPPSYQFIGALGQTPDHEPGSGLPCKTVMSLAVEDVHEMHDEGTFAVETAHLL